MGKNGAPSAEQGGGVIGLVENPVNGVTERVQRTFARHARKMGRLMVTSGLSLAFRRRLFPLLELLPKFLQGECRNRKM